MMRILPTDPQFIIGERHGYEDAVTYQEPVRCDNPDFAYAQGYRIGYDRGMDWWYEINDLTTINEMDENSEFEDWFNEDEITISL